MTLPIYFFTKSGYSLIASEIEQKIIPSLAKVSLNVVATETESITISTATPESFFCSSIEIPSLLKVLISSGSTSSRLLYLLLVFGAEKYDMA